jgi:peptide/nickel transport system permease protein
MRGHALAIPAVAVNVVRVSRARPPRRTSSATQIQLGAIPLGVIVALTLIGPFFAQLQLYSFAPPDLAPSPAHLMGTGSHGQDIFSEWVYGGRYSLAIGALAGLGCSLIAAIVGVTAGYMGGWVDEVLSFITNLFLAVPPFPAIFVVSFSFGVTGAWPLILVLTLMTWAYGASMLRSQTVLLRHREFVEAAASAGENAWRVMWYEVLPHLRGLMLFVLVNGVLIALTSEFGLEFLGWDSLAHSNALGGGWGQILANARYDNDIIAGFWWSWVFPGLGITLTSAALALIGAGIASRATEQR